MIEKHIKLVVVMCCLLVIVTLFVIPQIPVKTYIIGNLVAENSRFADKISFSLNDKGQHMYFTIILKSIEN